jgi:hypothetical protein
MGPFCMRLTKEGGGLNVVGTNSMKYIVVCNAILVCLRFESETTAQDWVLDLRVPYVSVCYNGFEGSDLRASAELDVENQAKNEGSQIKSRGYNLRALDRGGYSRWLQQREICIVKCTRLSLCTR